MNKKTYLAASLALLGGSVLSGCGDDSDSTADTSMLRYIPADSPYFMATRETMPEQEVFDFYKRTMLFDEGLEQDMEELRELQRHETDAQSQAFISLILALGEEVKSVETLDDLHERGIKAAPQAAFYGLGILPVLRFELEDSAAFRETLERVLANADITPRTGTTDGTDYWVLTPEDDVEITLALVDGQALLSLVPDDASDSLLAEVLGKNLPEESLDDTGALADLESRYGFTPYGAGQIRTARVLDELSSPDHAGTEALLASAGEEPLDFSACQADLDRITDRFPGIAMGSREQDLNGRSEMNLIVETDDAIVSDLRRLVTDVPGLGSKEGLTSFGMGLSLPVLLETVQTYSRQLRENPFGCAELQELNSVWDDANKTLSHPLMMMVGPSLSGLYTRVDSFYVENGMPAGTGLLTLASPNPMTLLQSASNFLPGFGELRLTPGGDAQRVESILLPPNAPELYAAMSESALALGLGSDDPSSLQDELKASSADENLLMHGFMAGDFFHAMANVAAQSPGDDFSKADIEVFRHYGDIYDQMEWWVTVGDAGLEMGFSVEMAEE
ncbi:hypothetical protein [Vreelandella sp. EE27]